MSRLLHAVWQAPWRSDEEMTKLEYLELVWLQVRDWFRGVP
jgi:hypothetical protein